MGPSGFRLQYSSISAAVGYCGTPDFVVVVILLNSISMDGAETLGAVSETPPLDDNAEPAFLNIVRTELTTEPGILTARPSKFICNAAGCCAVAHANCGPATCTGGATKASADAKTTATAMIEANAIACGRVVVFGAVRFTSRVLALDCVALELSAHVHMYACHVCMSMHM